MTLIKNKMTFRGFSQKHPTRIRVDFTLKQLYVRCRCQSSPRDLAFAQTAEVVFFGNPSSFCSKAFAVGPFVLLAQNPLTVPP